MRALRLHHNTSEKRLHNKIFETKKKSAAMPFGSEALPGQLFISANAGLNILI